MNVFVKSACVTLAFCALGLGSARAADSKEAEALAASKATTVWVDGKGQKSFADKVNKLSAEMTAKGWKFASLAIYTEDGDMQGAFVTYTRD